MFSKSTAIVTIISLIFTLFFIVTVEAVQVEANDITGTNTTDATVNIYLFDSGINANHIEFDSNIVHAYDAINDGETACHDHGTGAASLIGGNELGMAQNVTIHSIRVLDCDLIGNTSDILDAIKWVSDHAVYPAVVNMSLGSYDSDVYNEAVENLLVAKGITVVTAAGNKYGFDACNVSPAGANNVITVGSVDGVNNNEAAHFTGMGRCVDLFAPGTDVTMASDSETGYWTHSGTSYSAPIVTGCVATYLRLYPTAMPDDVRTALINSANSIVDGVTDGTTNHMLNCDFA